MPAPDDKYARGSIEKSIPSRADVTATWNNNCWKGEITALLVAVITFSRGLRIEQCSRASTTDVVFHAYVKVESNAR